jgi:MFS family permease
MVLLGVGAGIAFNPVLLAAMGDVEPHEAGLASGVVNTSFMMGGALGLAVLVAVSSWRTTALAAAGVDQVAALNGGFQLAFGIGAAFALVAAVVGGALLRPRPVGGPAEAPDAEATGARAALDPAAC